MAAKNERALTRGQRADLVTRAELGNMKLKAALFVLDQFANQSESRWPSINELASAMCGSKRTAQYAISCLRELGIIHYRDETTGLASRRYSIVYERLMEFQPAVQNLAFHPSPANRTDDPKNRGADSAPHAGLAPHATPAPHASGAPHAQPARQNRTDEPKNGGANGAPPTKQTKDVKKRSEQEPEKSCASQGPVCLLGSTDASKVKHAQQLVRSKLKAIELLKGNCVWDRDIGNLIELAARDRDDGNPLPRIYEAIEMCDDAKTTIKNRGGWIKEAIERGFEPRGRRRGASA